MFASEREPVAPERPERAVAEQPCVVPARLTVGAANDPLEREADRVADDVLRSIAAAGITFGGGTRVRRAAWTDSRGTPEVGSEGGPVADDVATKIRRSHGGGQPLDETTRSTMEP